MRVGQSKPAPWVNSALAVTLGVEVQQLAGAGALVAVHRHRIHGVVHLLDRALQQSQWGGKAQQVEQIAGEEHAALAADKPKYLN